MKQKYKQLGWLPFLLFTPVVVFGAVLFAEKGNAQTFGASSPNAPFTLVSSFKGYSTKPDPTNLSPEYLIAGSQNVIINDNEKVESRAGYELFGAASTTATAITSDYSWKTSGATSTAPSEILLRTSDNLLQFYATSTFEDLYTLISTSSPVRYAPVWNTTELIDELLFVNASSTLFDWSGARATYASSTATSIGINEVIGESRFLVSGTRQIRVKDSSGIWRTFTYTGQGISTFSGVTPDPTSFTFGTNALVVQAVRSNVNTPASGYVSNFIDVLQNQVFVGAQNSRVVYISQNDSFTDFSKSSPRVAGEGETVTLDDTTVGFKAPDDEKMLIFSGKDKVYQATFVTSSGSTADREIVKIKPLLVSAGQGALSQELIGKIKQAVVWVSNNQELVELGQVENLPSPQAVAISDPIKPDFDGADFTNGEVEFWRNNLVISAPVENKLFIFDMAKRFWQPPQTLGMRRLTQYGGNLYGHGNSVPETYQLFTGLSDNDNPISFKAHFAYQNGGRRDMLKNFDRFFTELYIAGNTDVTVKLLYEWLGAKQLTEYTLEGDNTDFLFTPNNSAALGVNPLGTNPLGGQLEAAEDTPKMRRFKPIVPLDFFEYGVRFESDSDDGVFEILSFGSNMQASGNSPVKLNK